MRSIAGKVALALFCGSVLIAAAKLPLPKDPIFGLTYDPSQSTFEAADGDLLRRCPELSNARWTRRMWVFARAETGEGRFVVIGGYYVRREPKAGEAPVETDDRGAVIQEKDAGCKLIGPAREVFDYPTEISKPTLALLAQDAVNRFIRAYGGKQKFIAALSRQKADLNDPRSRVLRDAVDAAP